MLENNFSCSSGFLAVDKVKELNNTPVLKAPKATGKLTRPYVKHLAALTINCKNKIGLCSMLRGNLTLKILNK